MGASFGGGEHLTGICVGLNYQSLGLLVDLSGSLLRITSLSIGSLLCDLYSCRRLSVQGFRVRQCLLEPCRNLCLRIAQLCVFA